MSQPFSILAFDHRSAEDKYLACLRVAKPFIKIPDSVPTEAFRFDEEKIHGSDEFSRLSKHSMIAPSVAERFRNRARHSKDVANVAEAIANKLNLGTASIALTRTIALMHDIGHPPFSHEGEAALNRKLGEYGLRFDHEQAGLELLLENNNIKFPLTVATIEGAVKRYQRDPQGPYREYLEGLEARLKGEHKGIPNVSLHLGKHNHIEGQVAATSDWIAATVSDLRDMMTYYLTAENDAARKATKSSGNPKDRVMAEDDPARKAREFFEQLKVAFPPAAQAYEQVRREWKGSFTEMNPAERKNWADRARPDIGSRVDMVVDAVCDKVKENLIADVVQHAAAQAHKFRTEGLLVHAEDVRDVNEMVASPSPGMIQDLTSLKNFYKQAIYPQIAVKHLNTQALVEQVFEDFMQGSVGQGKDKHDLFMKDGWNSEYQNIQSSGLGDSQKKRETAKLVAMYISRAMDDESVLHHIREYHGDMLKGAPTAPRPVLEPPYMGR